MKNKKKWFAILQFVDHYSIFISNIQEVMHLPFRNLCRFAKMYAWSAGIIIETTTNSELDHHHR